MLLRSRSFQDLIEQLEATQLGHKLSKVESGIGIQSAERYKVLKYG